MVTLPFKKEFKLSIQSAMVTLTELPQAGNDGERQIQPQGEAETANTEGQEQQQVLKTNS